MGAGNRILLRNLQDNFTTLENLYNGGMTNRNFAPYAQIAAAKIKDTAVIQTEVSVTHKGAGAHAAAIPRLSVNKDWKLPEKIGDPVNGTAAQRNYIFHKLADGAMQFFTTDTVRAFVDSSGWNNGAPPAAAAVTTMSIEFNSTLSYWIVTINNTKRAFVDANLSSGVFVNSEPLTGAVSTGASIDFSVADRINFRASFGDAAATVIGHIKVGGTFDGA